MKAYGLLTITVLLLCRQLPNVDATRKEESAGHYPTLRPSSEEAEVPEAGEQSPEPLIPDMPSDDCCEGDEVCCGDRCISLEEAAVSSCLEDSTCRCFGDGSEDDEDDEKSPAPCEAPDGGRIRCAPDQSNSSSAGVHHDTRPSPFLSPNPSLPLSPSPSPVLEPVAGEEHSYKGPVHEPMTAEEHRYKGEVPEPMTAEEHRYKGPTFEPGTAKEDSDKDPVPEPMIAEEHRYKGPMLEPDASEEDSDKDPVPEPMTAEEHRYKGPMLEPDAAKEDSDKYPVPEPTTAEEHRYKGPMLEPDTAKEDSDEVPVPEPMTAEEHKGPMRKPDAAKEDSDNENSADEDNHSCARCKEEKYSAVCDTSKSWNFGNKCAALCSGSEEGNLKDGTCRSLAAKAECGENKCRWFQVCCSAKSKCVPKLQWPKLRHEC